MSLVLNEYSTSRRMAEKMAPTWFTSYRFVEYLILLGYNSHPDWTEAYSYSIILKILNTMYQDVHILQ